MTDVKAIASWDGWCDPCGTERPLVLTEAGPRGLRAWLRGISWEDRSLGLYCRVCGEHQVVPLREEDDPVVVAPPSPLVVSLTRLGISAVTLSRPVRRPVATAAVTARTAEEAVVAPSVVPAQRTVTQRPAVASVALPDAETQLDLVAAGLAVA
jgi:hypothetical protein